MTEVETEAECELITKLFSSLSTKKSDNWNCSKDSVDSHFDIGHLHCFCFRFVSSVDNANRAYSDMLVKTNHKLEIGMIGVEPTVFSHV